MENLLNLSRRQTLVAGLTLGATGLVPSWAAAADGLDELVARQMKRAMIPGLAVGVARRGQVTFCRTYGFADLAGARPVTRNSMFHIASITKTVTALAIMQLVDRGRIALDMPVAPFLDFTILGVGASDITFRHLLMHTSGISDARYYDVDFREQGHDAALPIDGLLKDYLARGGRFAGTGNVKTRPGTTWDYSNIGFGLLGYLGSRIVGRDFRVHIREAIFRKLDLRHTAWSIADTPVDLRVTPYDLVDEKPTAVAPVGFPDWSAGMIRASIGDLAKLVAVATNHGMVDGKHVVSRDSVTEMFRMQRPAGLPAWLTGQGLAWQQSPLGATPVANHWGGDPGVFTMAYVDPEREIGVALLSNMSATPASREALKTIVASVMRGGRLAYR